MHQKETTELLEIPKKGKANVAALGGLQGDVLDVSKAATAITPARERARYARKNTEKKVRFLDVELSMLKRKEASFDGAICSVNTELSAARVEFTALWCNRNQVLGKLKTWETFLRHSLKVLFKLTTEGSSKMSM